LINGSRESCEIAERLPNARREVSDKAGHYVHMDTPRQLAEVLTDFLDEDARPRATITEFSENYIRKSA